MSKGRLKQYRKNVELLTKRMQFFCLDPQYNNFVEICNCNKLKSEQNHVFDIWKTTALACNGMRWISEFGERKDLNKNIIRDALILFIKNDENVLKLFNENPTDTRLDRIYYMFFASGRYKYLKACYEAIVNEKAKKKFIDIAVQMYDTIQEEYSEKINIIRKRGVDDIKSIIDCIDAFDKLNSEISTREKTLKKVNFDPTKHEVRDLGDLVGDEIQFVDQHVDSCDSVDSDIEECIDLVTELNK
jgi:hypothetical protein